MIKIILPSLSFILGFFILGLVVYVVGIDEILEIFSNLSPWGLVPLVGFTVLVNIISGLKWQKILGIMGYKIKLRSIIGIWLVGYAVSYLTPVVYVGGEMIRGYILKERHKVPWRHSLASIAIDKVSESVVWISTIFLGVLVFLGQPSAPALPRVISASILGMILLAVIVGVVYFVILKRKSVLSKIALKFIGIEQSRGAKFIVEVEKSFFDFFDSDNRKNFIWVLKISIIKYIILWMRNVFLIYYLLGIVSFGGGVMSLGFSYLSYITPIPAALGAQEAILSAVFANIGHTSGAGTAITFLIRFSEMLMVGVGCYYLLKWGIGRVILHITTLVKNSQGQMLR